MTRIALSIAFILPCLVPTILAQDANEPASAGNPSTTDDATSPPGYPSQGAAEFASDRPAAIEVMRAKTGHLLVKPTIHGKPGGWFIFDTGAGICVISEPHVPEFGLRESGTLDAVGVGSTKATLLRADSLALGSLTLHDLPMIALDLRFLKQHLGEEISGVIGYGLLAKCVAEIDLLTPAIALHDPAKFELKGAPWAETNLDKFIPVVTASFEGHSGRFTLDTGANDAVSFHFSAVESLDLLEKRTTTDAKLGGVGGTIATKRGRIGRFDLAGSVTTDLEATFELASKPNADPTIVGNIGVELLKSFVLTTDYGHRRLAFVPRSTTPDSRDGGW